MLIVTGIVGASYYSGFVSQLTKNDNLTNVTDDLLGWRFPVAKFPSTGEGELAYSDIRDPGGIPQGLPVRLKIPVIGVNSAVEDALITPDGRMDVPAGSAHVAWFALGPHPGQEGSAVIGGHFGIKNNVPFVFYRLDQLKTGDKIYIEDDRGDTLSFVVRRIRLFDRDADATSIFTSNDGLAHLNLITCEGIWNKVKGNYPLRRVVFTDAILPEDKAPSSMIVPSFYRTLTLGSRGEDVVSLQTALVAKQFLQIPRGVAMGYFGILTRRGVINYQNSVGLKANGIFDSLTRAKLMPEKPVAKVSPTLPTTSTEIPETAVPQTPETRVPQSSDITMESSGTFGAIAPLAKSLFATPIDGIVTLTLLGAIFIMLKKVMKKYLRE